MSKRWPWKAAAVPQRYIKGFGWVECQPHQATTWLACLGQRVLGRYGNKALALEAIRIAKLRQEGPKRRYKLGGVLEPRSSNVGTVARSMTQTEYDNAKR